MALIGMPPTNGFVSKLAVLLSGVHLERWGAVAVLVAASVMTLVYVSRSFQLMWWRTLPAGMTTKPAGDSTLAPAILVAACVLLGVWAQPLLRLANDNGEWLQRPEAYIQAVFPSDEASLSVHTAAVPAGGGD
jgi:multicomponent Na+:H+ antiporter subunit D